MALICLLETALSPFLVYVAVGERPSGQTVAAAVLIVLTLGAHGAYDLHLSRQRGGGHAGAPGAEEGEELLAAAAPLGDAAHEAAAPPRVLDAAEQRSAAEGATHAVPGSAAGREHAAA